jgi:hypothetical protein
MERRPCEGKAEGSRHVREKKKVAPLSNEDCRHLWMSLLRVLFVCGTNEPHLYHRQSQKRLGCLEQPRSPPGQLCAPLECFCSWNWERVAVSRS